MIYTLTPNPCLDLGGTVANLAPDEKAYVHDETRSPGGNSINSARIIKRLGAPVTATGFLGGGTGTEVKFLLDQEDVVHEFIKIQGHTRTNVTVSNCKDHRQTRLSFPGPKISSHERQALFKYIESIDRNSLLVIGGSLPPAFTGAHLLKILRLAKLHKIPTIVDVPGPLLKYAFEMPTLLIKPNLVELQNFTGKKVSSLQGVLKLTRNLTRKIPFICTSSVDGGALLVTPLGSWFGRIPKIEVKSTVGAGDSMVGAMSAYIWKESIRTRQPIADLAYNSSPEFPAELLKNGLAAACGTLALPGVMLASAKMYQKYLSKIEVRRLA
ncbi:MAG: hexose kinase [Bdellovibrionia bacterium]